jgi:uncharacterized protein (TIGR00251 family)
MTDVVVDVRVIPRAKKTELGGERDGAVLVRLAAPPVEGAANDALIAFLASTLTLPRRNIHIVGGERNRRKRVVVSGSSEASVRERLGMRPRSRQADR